MTPGQKRAKKLLESDPNYYKKIAEKSKQSQKRYKMNTYMAKVAAWKRWHPNEPLPEELTNLYDELDA